MSEQDQSANIAMAHMEAQCQVHGVASVKVRDGEIFMLSREMVESLVKRMQDTDQDRVLVFVKTGGILSKETMA